MKSLKEAGLKSKADRLLHTVLKELSVGFTGYDYDWSRIHILWERKNPEADKTRKTRDGRTGIV